MLARKMSSSELASQSTNQSTSAARRTGGPRIAWLALGLVGAMCGVSLLVEGFDEEGVRVGIRATARVTALLLIAVFSASALHRLFPSPPTLWLRVNRRYLGVSTAISHGYHLGLLVALYTLWVSETPSLLTLVGGGFVSLMLLLLAATSTNASQRKLAANWRRLHLLGIWSVWIVFAVSYFPRALEDPLAGTISAALMLSLGLRIWAFGGLFRAGP